jgi:membrane protein
MRRQLFRLKTTIQQTYQQIHTSDVSTLAGSLAFSTAVSLVPLLAVSLGVFTYFGGLDSLLHKIQPFILQNLVDASGAELSKTIRRAIERVHSRTLGLGGALGLMVASTKIFYDMEKAVHRVWGLANDRRLWRQFLIYWLLMFLGPLALAIVLGVLGSKDLGLIGPLPRAIVLVSFEFIALVSIYKFVPSIPVSWMSSLASGSLATLALAIAQSFYSTIMKTVFNTNKIYGSLASVPLFLIWILILWWICLTGVAFCSVLEKRRIQNEMERLPLAED